MRENVCIGCVKDRCVDRSVDCIACSEREESK
jgi:hypothetical protein